LFCYETLNRFLLSVLAHKLSRRDLHRFLVKCLSFHLVVSCVDLHLVRIYRLRLRKK
jgi:hypothetical protein